MRRAACSPCRDQAASEERRERREARGVNDGSQRGCVEKASDARGGGGGGDDRKRGKSMDGARERDVRGVRGKVTDARQR